MFPVRLLADDTPPATPPQGASADLSGVIVWAVIAVITLVVLARRGVLSTRSLERTRARRVDRLPSILWLTAGLGMYSVWMLAGSVGAAIADGRKESVGELGAGAVALWAGYAPVVAIAAVALIAAKSRRTEIARDLAASGWRLNVSDIWRGGGALLLTIPVYFLVAITAASIADRIRGVQGDAISHELLGMLAASDRGIAWWAVVVAVVVAAPIVEEAIYRGCVQSGVAGLTRSRSTGVVVTAMIFSAAHAGVVRPEALAGLFVLGLAFGLAFERTGRLGVPIFMHGLFNALNLALAIYTT